MVLDWLLDPASADAPCGPDLERTDDPDFLDYYFEAEGRLPDRYFIPGAVNAQGGTEDRLFDPRSIDLPRETAAIVALLRRSRDLRLLGLLARFQILAGRLGEFAGTLDMMAGLIGARIAEVHPQMTDSPSARRGALDALAEQPTVIMPLAHLPVVPGTDLTLRRHQLATGAATPRSIEGEDLPDPGQLLAGLRAQGWQVAATHADLSRAVLALNRIVQLCRGNGPVSFTPGFDATFAVIADIQAMIATALPELRPWTDSAAQEAAAAAPPPAAPGEGRADKGGTDERAADEGAAARVPVRAGPAIPDHAAAAAALEAVETYLARHEPSSLSLLLVAQARMLVGKSIVEAVDLLLPGRADRAELTLGKAPGFTIDMARLRQLAQSVPQQEGARDDATATVPVAVNDRTELAGFLRNIEEFYLKHEPASPIPVLLAEAGKMLSKTFSALIGEILPHDPGQG